MFATGKNPNRHLHAGLLDLVLAAGAMAAHTGAIRLDNPNWALLPHWLWPGLAVAFLLSALFSFGRHRATRR
ncbi:MAG TPA: hypothetical protein VL118_01685 [Luteimonas sp.]|jgi:hypothetical protein|nr:hypothetical protein [Luteimonas sp.]